MGHKPWDRGWKRTAKRRARRQWEREEAESLAELAAGESVTFIGPGWVDRSIAWLMADDEGNPVLVAAACRSAAELPVEALVRRVLLEAARTIEQLSGHVVVMDPTDDTDS